jgi:hypothetical protein
MAAIAGLYQELCVTHTCTYNVIHSSFHLRYQTTGFFKSTLKKKLAPFLLRSVTGKVLRRPITRQHY